MIAFDIEGTIDSISGVEKIQTGKGETTKCELVLVADAERKYPTYLHITFWDKNVGNLAGLQSGTQIRVRSSVRSKKREFNGRAFWNTTLTGLECMVIGETVPQQDETPPLPHPATPEVPRYTPPAPQPQEEEDIPF